MRKTLFVALCLAVLGFVGCGDDDAPAAALCGDGVCAAGETCGACATDCGCAVGERCTAANVCEACPDADHDAVCDADDVCAAGDDALDTDDDGVPNACDVCTGGDDQRDTDADGVPNDCDICAAGDDTADADGDGVPDACDVCAAGDDALDTDDDGVPNACDTCVGDSLRDADGDGVPDACDICAAGDDTVDGDVDGVPDACDVCLTGIDSLDADADGVPDACDVCASGDDALDADGDGVPDHCDVCADGDDSLDADGDAVPDHCDVCAGGDDTVDADADGVPDHCDICAGGDDTVDADADGVPDHCDVCPGGDDTIDANGDGVPDACEGGCAGGWLTSGDFSTASGWTPSGVASVDPSRAGHDSVGVGILGSTSLSRDGTLTTTPRLSATVPTTQGFGLDFWLTYDAGIIGMAPSGEMQVLLNGTIAWKRSGYEVFRGATAGVFAPVKACFGQQFYAGLSSFSISGLNGASFSPGASIVDDLCLRPTDTGVCPAVGATLNGGFEAGSSDWRISSGALTVEPDGATNHVLHMVYPAGCGGPGNIVSGVASVPLATTLPNAAVRFRLRGDWTGSSTPWTMRLEYPAGQTSLVSRSWLPAGWETVTTCAPAAALGQVVSVVFAFGVSCGDGYRAYDIDDVEVVSAPGDCP